MRQISALEVVTTGWAIFFTIKEEAPSSRAACSGTMAAPREHRDQVKRGTTSSLVQRMVGSRPF